MSVLFGARGSFPALLMSVLFLVGSFDGRLFCTFFGYREKKRPSKAPTKCKEPGLRMSVRGRFSANGRLKFRLSSGLSLTFRVQYPYITICHPQRVWQAKTRLDAPRFLKNPQRPSADDERETPIRSKRLQEFRHRLSQEKKETILDINNTMDMDGDDHTNHSGDDDTTGFCKNMPMTMSMGGFQSALFFGGRADCITFLFPGWDLDGSGKFVSAMICTFFLAVSCEGMVHCQHHVRNYYLVGKSKQLRKLIVSLIYGFQQLMGWTLMLISMSFSMELFACVVVGIFIGKVLFPKESMVPPHNASINNTSSSSSNNNNNNIDSLPEEESSGTSVASSNDSSNAVVRRRRR